MLSELNKISTSLNPAGNGTSDVSPSNSLHSRLYSILKSEDVKKRKTANDFVDEMCNPFKKARVGSLENSDTWKSEAYDTDTSLQANLDEYSEKSTLKEFKRPDLVGCPFCPMDEHHANDTPFTSDIFDCHLKDIHPEITSLYCPYCLTTMSTNRLLELVNHIVDSHKLPWNPSPASLVYLRRDELPHRVVTCMGCGWCTFVLRASNAVQPPTALQEHMGECPFNGGRVALTHLDPESYSSKYSIEELVSECDQLTQLFMQTFPLVRGYPNESSSTELNLHYRQTPPTNAAVTLPDKIPSATPRKKPASRKAAPKTPQVKQNKVSRSRNSKTTRMEFDVPITLPPQPATVRKQTSGCVYVCPLCGDNALASLRERDEHLQSAHNGELVFPCQVCGLAYPLYIALRRHAALKHNADYDLVRYGPPELLDNDPIECPVCRLVAFTDRTVLLLHLSEIHGVDLEKARTLLNVDDANSCPDADNVRRKGSRAVKRDSEKAPKKPKEASAAKPKSEKRRHKAPSLSRLEVLLGQASGDPAPMSCRLCRTTMDNAKEFRLHMELDHAETEECEQLGCQACGRIFFGSGGRIDLIGHLRVLHQDAEQSSALSCPHAERKSTDTVAKDGTAVHIRPCEAMFSSPRLRQIHAATSMVDHPSFACPLALELPDCENAEALDLSEQLRAAIMETECSADRAGLMILAYCCPNCSRLFAGFQAPVRFASHRLACQIEARPVVEPVQPTPPTQTAAPQTRPPGATTLLESVLREEPLIPIRR